MSPLSYPPTPGNSAATSPRRVERPSCSPRSVNRLHGLLGLCPLLCQQRRLRLTLALDRLKGPRQIVCHRRSVIPVGDGVGRFELLLDVSCCGEGGVAFGGERSNNKPFDSRHGSPRAFLTLRVTRRHVVHVLSWWFSKGEWGEGSLIDPLAMAAARCRVSCHQKFSFWADVTRRTNVTTMKAT